MAVYAGNLEYGAGNEIFLAFQYWLFPQFDVTAPLVPD